MFWSQTIFFLWSQYCSRNRVYVAVIETTGIRVVCHHDFWWEPARTYYHNQTTLWGREVMKTFVPRLYNSRFRHCVINSPAQQELKKDAVSTLLSCPMFLIFLSPPGGRMTITALSGVIWAFRMIFSFRRRG